MRWKGNTVFDLTISLVDDSESVTLGQIMRDVDGPDWRAREYVSNNGKGSELGEFQTSGAAKAAVQDAVNKFQLE